MARGEFNPARGDSKLEVGGKTYILRYTLRSLAELQEKLGRDRFKALLDGDMDFADFEFLGVLVTCGLRYHHGADGELDGVMDEIGLADMGALSKAIADAFTGAFPAAKEGGETGPTEPAKSKPRA
jgi:hypothetical protein